MPNIYRYSIKDLYKIVEKACKLKIPLIALFPHTNLSKKNEYGTKKSCKKSQNIRKRKFQITKEIR